MRAAAASLQRPGRGGGGGRRPAPSKAALPGGVAETVLAQLEPDSADPGRAAQLRTAARGCRQLALARRHVVPLLVTRPLATPLALRPLGTLRPLEDVPALLARAGFSGPGALHIYRALPGFLHGASSTPGTHRQPRRDRRPAPPRPAPAAGRRDPPAARPRLRPRRLRRPAEPGRGPGILLAGLTTTLPPQAK